MLAGLYRNVSLVIRTPGEPTALVPSVRAALQAIDRDQPLVRVRTMEQAIGDTVAQPRLQALLLVIFASVAVALAVVGVYGVMAYVVSQRTQEIGVRVALGASRSDVVRMVVTQAARLAALGIAIWTRGSRRRRARAAESAVCDERARSADVRPCTDRPWRRGARRELSAGTPCGGSRADYRAWALKVRELQVAAAAGRRELRAAEGGHLRTRNFEVHDFSGTISVAAAGLAMRKRWPLASGV